MKSHGFKRKRRRILSHAISMFESILIDDAFNQLFIRMANNIERQEPFSVDHDILVKLAHDAEVLEDRKYRFEVYHDLARKYWPKKKDWPNGFDNIWAARLDLTKLRNKNHISHRLNHQLLRDAHSQKAMLRIASMN